jgi:regulatory protein
VQKPAKKISPAEAKQKIYAYCAYQERAHQEVRDKLFAFGLYSGEVDEILSHLVTEGYLNEERFARAFAGGKFRVKNWGRIKIIHELEARGLTKNCIHSGMKEINEADYLDVLQTLLKKKSAQLDGENSFVKSNKLAKYAIQKGFESELVWKCIKAMTGE